VDPLRVMPLKKARVGCGEARTASIEAMAMKRPRPRRPPRPGFLFPIAPPPCFDGWHAPILACFLRDFDRCGSVNPSPHPTSLFSWPGGRNPLILACSTLRAYALERKGMPAVAPWRANPEHRGRSYAKATYSPRRMR